MNVFQLVKLRLINGKSLEYNIYSFFKLVLFVTILSKLNRYKYSKCDSFLSLDLTNIQILVISLSYRVDRRSRIEKSLLNNKLEFLFVDAISGSQKGLYSNLGSKFTKESLAYLSSGSIGCILSHHKALMALQSSSYNYALILEDDVILKDDFDIKLKEILLKIPSDFDILYLGSSNAPNKNLVSWMTDGLYIPFYPRKGQYSYLISKKAAVKVIDNLFPIKIVLGGIGTIVGRMVSKGLLIAYHVFPNCVEIDRTISSDIYNPSTPKKNLNKNN